MSDTQKLTFAQTGEGELRLAFCGDWKLTSGLPSVAGVASEINSRGGLRQITCDAEDLEDWDSGLIFFITRLREACRDREIALDISSLPDAARKLLELLRVPKPSERGSRFAPKSLLAELGEASLSLKDAVSGLLVFLGEATLSFLRFARGKARFQRADLALLIQQAGSDALPIVSLISFLVGLILAFMGAVQLEKFGAQIFVADLVGLATTREMAPMMVAIVMAGRTGAAYAAQLAAMRVSEEVDAFRSLGILPMDYLVLPRMLALVLMMPLLTIYADFIGIFGGLVIAISVMDLSYVDYVNRTLEALSIGDVVLGLVKSVVFGVLIAIAGCSRGLIAQASASAVGAAATSAVVLSLVLIISSDGVFAAITNVLDI